MTIQIKLARVDKRLLHATVALNWSNFINANHVVVVDPSYINDPFMMKVMQLCLPKTMKVDFLMPEELGAFMQQESYQKINVMIIFKDLHAARQSVEAGLTLSELQLPYPASRMMIKTMHDYFNPEEIDAIRAMQKLGVQLYFQTAPHDNKEYAFFKKKESKNDHV